MEIEKEEKIVPAYSEEEELYRSKIVNRLSTAKENRDKQHKEFDYLTYTQYLDANEAGANTYLKSVKNKGEKNFQSGTIRNKLMAYVNAINQLNLSPDIIAYDENDIPIQILGKAIEDIIERLDEIDGDEEKKLLREYELCMQGHVFIEDVWEEKTAIIKKMLKKWNGKEAKWNTLTKNCISNPTRTIITPASVYLGNIREYFIHNQPYIFTMEYIPYSEARAIYGEWEMFKYVPETVEEMQPEWVTNMKEELDESEKKEMVQVIKYQSKPDNEFQIFLSGVMMLPAYFPLTPISADGQYTIEQQNLQPIKTNFAYGKSVVFEIKNLVAVMDEFLKMGVGKTQASFKPAMLNMSNRIVNSDIFNAGKFTRGIFAGQLKPVLEKLSDGVTAAEFGMIDKVKSIVDENTVSPTTTGSMEGGSATATQILEVQRQAKMMMGVMITSAALLEKKLAVKRKDLTLIHWFEPTGDSLDEARNVIKSKYRQMTKYGDINGELGYKMIRLSDENKTAAEIRVDETKASVKAGKKVKIVQISPQKLKMSNLIWKVNVVPKEKKSSELSKILFSQMMTDAMNLGLQPSIEYMRKRFAQVWEESPEEMFPESLKQEDPNQPNVPGNGGQFQPPKVKPELKMSPELNK